jgi:hypothetical protein
MWGGQFPAILAALIVGGAPNLARFDAALADFTLAALPSTFGIYYRYAAWIQRPPTAIYWRRAPQQSVI